MTAVVAAVTALVVLAGVLIVWSPWSEREFAADEVPSSCSELFAVKEAELPGAPDGKQELFDRPGVSRVGDDGSPGSTLMCGWANEVLVLRVHVEYWAGDVDAAAASFAATREEWREPVPADIGDEAVLWDVGAGVYGLARIGNVIMHTYPVVMPPAEVTVAVATRILEGLVAVVEA